MVYDSFVVVAWMASVTKVGPHMIEKCAASELGKRFLRIKIVTCEVSPCDMLILILYN